jgi:hypothetical protein
MLNFISKLNPQFELISNQSSPFGFAVVSIRLGFKNPLLYPNRSKQNTHNKHGQWFKRYLFWNYSQVPNDSNQNRFDSPTNH